MEQKITIRRSSVGIKAQIITTGIMALLLGLLSSWLIAFMMGWTPNEGTLMKVMAWVAFIGGWGITSLKLWSDWKIKRYEVTPEAIIVHARAGQWGSTQTLYRYESIISIKMSQGYWGKKYNFGDVRMTIPKLENDVVMNDIEEPLVQLAEIQKRMGERSGGSQNLIT